MATRRLPTDIQGWRDVPSVHGEARLAGGSPVADPSRLRGLENMVTLPPHIYPPRDSQNIYGEGQADLTGPFPAAGSFQAIASFTVPSNNVGVVRELTLNINGIAATTDVRWTLRFNGGGVQGFTDLTIFPRAAGSVSATFPAENTVVKFDDAVTIDVLVRVVDGGSYKVGASYRGWYYSKKTAQLYGAL